jgi:hypothetical protein
VPHLSHRRRIYQLDERPIPTTDAYAIDLYTWIYPFTTAAARRLVVRLREIGYGVRCSEGGTAVLARGGGGSLSPELRRLLRPR